LIGETVREAEEGIVTMRESRIILPVELMHGKSKCMC
jgi:hypothetical protein